MFFGYLSSLPDFDITLVSSICLENWQFHSDFPILLSKGFVVRTNGSKNFLTVSCYVSLFITDFIYLNSVCLLLRVAKALAILTLLKESGLFLLIFFIVYLFVTD